MSLIRTLPAASLHSLSAALMLALVLPALTQTADASSGTGDSVSAKTLATVHVNAYRTTTHPQSATKTDISIAEASQSVSAIARE